MKKRPLPSVAAEPSTDGAVLRRFAVLDRVHLTKTPASARPERCSMTCPLTDCVDGTGTLVTSSAVAGASGAVSTAGLTGRSREVGPADWANRADVACDVPLIKDPRERD
jgi:hypothetical protein